MKRPFIFCTSYIDSEYIYENRYKKWYSYYRKKTNLPIFFIDDASTFNLVDTENVNLNIDVCDSVKINFHTFKTHLGRPGDFYVPGWARSFFYSLEIAKKFNFDSINSSSLSISSINSCCSFMASTKTAFNLL